MKENGYTGFEPRVEWGHVCGIEADLPADRRRETRDLFVSEGLEICCLATGVRMAEPDTSERARHIEDLRRYLDLAADLGCGLVRTFGGRRDRGAELPAVVDYVASGYRQVVDQAREAGVTLLLETHDDWSATAPVRAVIEAVDHPSLQVLWDFMHPQRMMETPAESFLAVGMLTRHTHAHDGRCVDGGLQLLDRLGDGEIDHAVPLQLLRRAGFEGLRIGRGDQPVRKRLRRRSRARPARRGVAAPGPPALRLRGDTRSPRLPAPPIPPESDDRTTPTRTAGRFRQAGGLRKRARSAPGGIRASQPQHSPPGQIVPRPGVRGAFPEPPRLGPPRSSRQVQGGNRANPPRPGRTGRTILAKCPGNRRYPRDRLAVSRLAGRPRDDGLVR